VICLGFAVWVTPWSGGWFGVVILVLRTFPELAERSVQNLVEIDPVVRTWKGGHRYKQSLFWVIYHSLEPITPLVRMGNSEVPCELSIRSFCSDWVRLLQGVKKSPHPKLFSWNAQRSWVTRQMLQKQDQWDTCCVFTELAGFYTLETDQDKLTVGSGIIRGRIQVKDPDGKSLEGNSQTVNLSLNIKQTVCTYVTMYPFHARTAGPIYTKFFTDLPANLGKVLNTSMTLPTRPLDPGVPQTLKPLCNVKCPDGWCKLIVFPGQCRGLVG